MDLDLLAIYPKGAPLSVHLAVEYAVHAVVPACVSICGRECFGAATRCGGVFGIWKGVRGSYTKVADHWRCLPSHSFPLPPNIDLAKWNHHKLHYQDAKPNPQPATHLSM